ncbi:FHA domain-containing protein [Variovorax saccharolyticus]|uniref:FHA domain-containing protein n=1 Tax=Variovorax saccharolyticus TaxID=3053516 RepID=UPI0025779D2C|nr:FHA domain-containing protein [Variovorax sp. J31P216]
MITLDVSASIGKPNFDTVKRHVVALLAKLPPSSRVALIAIGKDVRVVRRFGLPSDIASAVDGLVPDSPETALYEAVLAAQDLAARAGPSLPLRRLVLVLTDGIDDSRKGFSREEALRKIAEGDAPVFALALSPAKPPAAQLDAIKSLAQIARTSGGAFVQSTAAEAGDNLWVLMSQAMATQLLTLDCSACVRDGVVRTLQVSMQQREGVATTSRELRLTAIVPPTPPQPPPLAPVASEGPPISESSVWWQQPKSWMWLVALACVLAAASVGVSVHYRHAQHEPQKEDVAVRRDGLDPAAMGDESLTCAAIYSAADAKSGHPVTLDVAGQGRLQIRVGQSDVVFGRSKSADVAMVGDTEASSKHAALYCHKDALMVRDLGSANGTYLNGTRIVRPEPIQDRDLVLVGRTEVRVYLGAS